MGASFGPNCGPIRAFSPDADREVAVRPDAFRAYVTIVRGCNHACSYCIVPFTRGREISRSVPEVLSEVHRLVDDGAREITFLGQNINTYGADLRGSSQLPTLLEQASEIEGLDRIRFLTSNPFDMTEEMMRRFGQIPKVMPWLHIPAQSGCDDVLRRMKRTYTVDQYREVVGWAREHIPGVEITSDFIVGFSGESDAEFDRTLALVREIGFFADLRVQVLPATQDARRTSAPRRRAGARQARTQCGVARRPGRAGHCAQPSLDRAPRGRFWSRASPSPIPRGLRARDRANRIVHCAGDATLAGTMAVVEIEEVGAHSLIGRRVAIEGDTRWTLRPALDPVGEVSTQ